MANHNKNERPEREATKSLVLSLFKGENFAVKGGSVHKTWVTAKCADLKPESTFESGSVRLTAGNSEPEFNSQMAWTVTRKQLKELRSNRSTIRVSCIIKDEKSGTENEIGYVVLHVKDATTFNLGDVDPTKARTYTLLGTKDPWRGLQPKLHMIIHLEDRIPDRHLHQHQPPTGFPKSHEVSPTKPPHVSSSEMLMANAAKLSETKLLENQTEERFSWTVKEKDGYFQLGIPADNDDLYILNITIVSVSYLHLLWDGRSARKRNVENYFWQLKYSAFGCEIASDPFLLANNESRRTFIGDKASARIRTNGGLFFEYLENTNLAFKILRYQPDSEGELRNEEVMGFCFAPLNELTDPNKDEWRVSLEIVSEWGTPRVISSHEKPEVRVVINMDTVPNYFALCQPVKNDEVDLTPTPEQNSNNGNTETPAEKEFKTDADAIHHHKSDILEESINRSTEEENNYRDTVAVDGIEVDSDIINHSNARRLLEFENKKRESFSSPSESLASPRKEMMLKNLYNRVQKMSKFSNESNDIFSESSDDSVENEELAKILPDPGEYKVTIELVKFGLKSRRILRDRFFLSYIHPPLGISDEPVECIGEPLASSDGAGSKQGFRITDGEFTKSFMMTKFSERLLNEPLTVEFRKILADGATDKCVASSMIHFGRIFAEKGHNQIWILEDTVDILRIRDNVKIGNLDFKILLSRDSNVSPLAMKRKNSGQSSFFPRETGKSVEESGKIEAYCRDPRDIERTNEEMKECRRMQEEIYKTQREEKESAYLKILSDEAAKRDAERENVMAKKLADIDRKSKELDRQRQLFEEKSEKLRLVEIEMKDDARQHNLKQEDIQQKMKLYERRLEENHKIEIGSLSRQIQIYEEEVEKLKSKVSVLEKKLESKDAEIDNLLALRRQQPNVREMEKSKDLEHQNKNLKLQLQESNKKKEQYRKQSLALFQKLSRVQEERDLELKDQNENLRLHILASKEHKELKKERKAVQGLSETLKAFKSEPQAHEGKGDEVDSIIAASRKSNGKLESKSMSREERDEEIQRLTDERSGLLSSGAYTQYDLVIKEMEKKIVSLTQK